MVQRKVHPPDPTGPHKRRDVESDFVLRSRDVLGLGTPRALAFGIAWRQYWAGNGPLPVSAALLDEAVAAWPSREARAHYGELLRSWRPPVGLRRFDPLDYFRRDDPEVAAEEAES